MKLSLTWISSILLLASIGCTKESNPTPDRRIANILPEVNLDSDIQGYPFPDIRITPSIVDAESNIFILTWTILSGPEDLKIPQSYDQHVLLKNLKNGSYEIELSVKNVGGVVKDTMNLEVNLQPIDNGEITFNNLHWTLSEFGWGVVFTRSNVHA